MAKRKQISGLQWLAWGGWQIRILPEWRPLKVEGNLRRGHLIVADSDRPVMQIKWARIGRADRFDAKKWINDRLGKKPPRTSTTGPRPDAFGQQAWAPLVETARGGQRSMWLGCCLPAGLVVEVVIPLDRPEVRAAVLRDSLPTLDASRRDQPTRWSVFGASFELPSGFDVTGKQLRSGQMCLLATARGGRRLDLRQIYPAALALARKDEVAWLRGSPFVERRKFHPDGEPEAWSVDSFGRSLPGLLRWGRKKLPRPLDWAAPRSTIQAAVRDEQLDRLLIAEYDAPGQADERVVAEAIGRMNWAMLCDGET